MNRSRKNKMTKDTVPEGFSLQMALVDAIPVILFGLSAVRVGSLFGSRIFIAGALICLFSGAAKVLWKLIAAAAGKNVWPLFVQMRILMPAGFAIMLAALIIDRARLSAAAVVSALTGFPACVFFAAGALGMIAMLIFAFRMDSANPRVNWLEQGVNSAAQLCFFIGLLLV